MRCRLDRITFHYKMKGEGRPLLALHGMPLDHRSMLNDIEPLFKKKKGGMRIYPDLPGMGKTKGPDWVVFQNMGKPQKPFTVSEENGSENDRHGGRKYWNLGIIRAEKK